MGTDRTQAYHHLPAGWLKAVQLLPLFPSQTSSFSSVTDSTMSLNIITVTLNMGMEGACGWGEDLASRAHGGS